MNFSFQFVCSTQIKVYQKSSFLRAFLVLCDSRAYFHGLCPKNKFFLNISNLSKNYLKDFFILFSNFGPGMVQLKYQRAKRLKFSFLVL